MWTAMWRIGPVLVFGICWLLEADPALADLYRCVRADGSEIFTNKADKPEGVTDCKEYKPESTLGVLPSSPKAESPVIEVYPHEGPSAPPRQERAEERHVPGQINFETYRMLSTGMTETEVMVRLGPPRYKFRLSIGTVVWSYVNDDWIVEITFSGGRVAEIDRYRPRP